VSAPRLFLGGVPVDRVTAAAALDRIEGLIAARAGGAVFTPNVDHVVLAARNGALAAAYRRVELSLADGMPVVWASRLLGAPVPEKVSGADLVFPLAERAARRGWRLYLLGGAPGTAEEAARRLRALFPALTVAGTDAPLLSAAAGDPGSPAALERLRAARPDLVLVALGAPKQELWIDRHRAALRPAVAVGVGAALDFVAGRARRAPRLVSRAGLEWLWRLGHEPRRLWRRYLVQDPAFAAILWRELRARRRGEGPNTSPRPAKRGEG
jgi:N-acetylglucosaminyldiphosphoundecaprenol N-acetyl-beta-D-mannosaminyltransferase